MATSGTGAIITRGQLVNKFGAAYWKNKTLPTTTSDKQCVTAEWINNNINSPNYRWTQAGTYSGAGKKLVKAVHCYNGSTNYLEPVITYDYSIAFSAAPSNINVGSTGKFTVTLTTKTYTGGELSNTTTTDVSSSCTWTSSSTANATVSSNGTVTGVKGLNDGTSNGKAVTITASHPTHGTLTASVNIKDVITYDLVLNKSTASIYWYAGTKTVSLAATYRTFINNSLASNLNSNVTSSATWTSNNTAKATVSAGTVTGKATGSATITATYSGKSASCTVTVNDYVSERAYSVDITTANFTLQYGGTTTQQLAWKTYNIQTINGVDNGSAYEVTEKTVTFKSNKTGNATVNSSGKVTWVAGAANGTENGVSVTITATYSGKTDTVTCTTKDKTAKGGVKSRRLVVSASKTSLSAGGTATLSAKGYTTYKLNINGTDSNSYNWGEDNDGAVSCTWSTSNANVASISSTSGSSITVTGVQGADGYSTAAATANIKAVNSTYNSSGVTTTISVTNVLSTRAYSVDITTSNFTLQYGGTTSKTLTVKTYDINVRNGVDHGSAYEVTEKTVTFKSNKTGNATVNSSGKVTWVAGAANGTENGVSVTITATYSGKTDTVTCTTKDKVTQGALKSTDSVAVTLASGQSANINAYGSGRTAQLVATRTGTYYKNINNSQSTYTMTATDTVTSSATWTSSSTSNATVSSSGLVTGKLGSSTMSAPSATAKAVTITATIGGKSGTYTVNVTDVLGTKYTIAPGIFTDPITVGSTCQLTPYGRAYVTYNGIQSNSYTSEAIKSSSTWSSSNSNNASVSSSGLVTAKAGAGDGTTNTVSVAITCTHSTYGTVSYGFRVKDSVSYGIAITTPSSAATISVGATQVYKATGYVYLNSGTSYAKTLNKGDVTSACTWTSSNTSVATMSGATATGKAGKGDGTETTVSTTIKAVHSTYGSATQTLNVKDVITNGSSTTMTTYSNLKVTPASTSITVSGATGSGTMITSGTVTKQTWTRTYKKINGTENKSYYTDGTKTTTTGVSTTNYTLTSGDTNKIKITGTAMAIMGGTTGGNVTVTATGTSAIGTSLTSSFTMSITCKWCTVTVSPTSASVYVGNTQRITPTRKKYTNGTASTGTESCSWSSSNTTYATVSPTSGTYTTVIGKAVGSATITATYSPSGYGSATATSTISVVAKPKGKLKIACSVSATNQTSDIAYSSSAYSGANTYSAYDSWLNTQNMSDGYIFSYNSSGNTAILNSNGSNWKAGYYNFLLAPYQYYRISGYINSTQASTLNSGTDVTVSGSMTQISMS